MAERSFSSVFHSLESVLNFLKNSTLAETCQVQELLHVFSNNYDKDVPVQSKHQCPFIVIEGLDGSGKTTLLKMLQKKTKGMKMSTPPTCLSHLRSWFDKQPNDLRRAFYSLGNYIVGQEVQKALHTEPVVMDRFWHSTAAYAIADEVKAQHIELPPRNDPVYEWPKDLTKPDRVLFLNVSEYWRTKRLVNRTITPEEQHLANDTEWRNNVVEAYKRMSNVELSEVNANQTPKKVYLEVEKLLPCF